MSSHYQSSLDAVYVYVVPWSEFPIVPSYPHYPQDGVQEFGGGGGRGKRSAVRLFWLPFCTPVVGWGSGFRVQGGVGVQGSELRVDGLVLTVEGVDVAVRGRGLAVYRGA